MKLHFQVNAEKSAAVSTRAALETRARRLGIDLVSGREADVVIALGGDGTLLRAVHEYAGVPVLGFNLGGLGYLSSVAEGDFDAALAALAEGRYRISERGLLQVGSHTALNDIVITREMSGHSTRLDLEADGKLVTHYMADGLIFATPTGSTAYSLAAGGPVLMPDSGCLVVTPMNPHALGVRPLVVSDGVTFTVTPRPRTQGNVLRVGIYADGENVGMLEEGQRVTISKSGASAKLVELEGYDPYDVLARKLGWSGSNVK